MQRLRLGFWLVLVLLGALVAHKSAAAQVQGCDDDATAVQGDFEVTPLDRAEQVARNAPIVVRFADDVDLDQLVSTLEDERDVAPEVPCAGELVCLLEISDDEPPREIEADVVIDEQTIRLDPNEPLAPDTDHTVLIVQPGLDAIARKERGFRTSDALDRERPVLGYGADDVQVSVTELPPECMQPAGSRRVVLELPAASDDGDPESVELEIKLTSARGLDHAVVRARAHNEGDPVVVSFVLSAEEADGRVCLAVRAIDAVGRASERPLGVCFNPSTRPTFESACAVGTFVGASTRDKSGGAWALVLAVVLFRTLPRRRAL